MKRGFLLLMVLVGIAAVSVYGLGGREQAADDDSAEGSAMSMSALSQRVEELSREQKELKDAQEKSNKDMEGLSRKLESLTTSQYIDGELEQAFEGYDDQIDAEQNDDEQAVALGEEDSSEAEISGEEIAAMEEPSDDEEIIVAEISDAEIPDEEIAGLQIDDGVIPPIPQNIILAAGERGYLTQNAVVDFITKYSRPPSWFGRGDIESLVTAYFREAGNERVNPDIAIAQMWHATQSLTHYGLLRNCNYANLEPVRGVQGMSEWDGTFSNINTGVRAHIQHLKGYASEERPQDIVDPRYEILAKNNFLGRGDTVSKLCAIWSRDAAKYQNNLNDILNSMYQHQFEFIRR